MLLEESPICRICGIKYPILLGPMLHITTAPFVAAFSEAGGLGCLTSGEMTKEQFASQVASIRSLTDMPFAVNIAWMLPNSKFLVDWCIEHHISIVISSSGISHTGIGKLKKSGKRILQVVSNVEQAVKAEDSGADAVIAKGYESGGVNALNAVATLPLLPQVVDAISIPTIAAGGIVDGRGMAAAFALGVDGVLMGTRFLASHECPIHDHYKKALVNATDVDTICVRLPSFTLSFWKNRMTTKLEKTPIPEHLLWKQFTDLSSGDDPDFALMGAGQGIGLVKSCLPVAKIVEEVVQGFKTALNRANKMTFG